MGVLYSRFRRKKETTFQILERLENKIKKIEDFRRDTEQRQKTIVGQLIVYSVGIYVLAAVFFYFYFFPEDLKGKVLCITPLLVFPIIVVLIKRLVTWYFHRKIVRNQELISEMKDEKRQLLENVKDKETYKIAKEILEKFAPDQLRRPMPIVTPTSSKELVVAGKPSPPAGSTSSDLRKRPLGTSMAVQRPGSMGSPQSPSALMVSPTNNGQFPVQRGPPMPRPVLPRDRGYLDKVVEYLVGDGPSNRYALICRQCQSHNGMALKEEFEYLAFRCCYCYVWNPARKQRPLAPRLQMSPTGEQESSLTSGSELESDADTTEDSDGEELSRKESLLPEKEEKDVTANSSNEEILMSVIEPDVERTEEVPPSEAPLETNGVDAKTVDPVAMASEPDTLLDPPAVKSSSNLYLSDL